MFEYTGTSVPKVVMTGKQDFNEMLAAKFGKRFREYRRSWDVAGPHGELAEFPLFLDIEPAYECNLGCSTCVFSLDEKTSPYTFKDKMSLDMFERICKEAKENQMPSVSVTNNNEGLMMPDLINYIETAASHGIMDIFAGTNAVLLNEEMALKLINSSLTRLLVSIDAASDATYQKTRNSKLYSRVVANTKRFVELRNKLGKQFPLLRVSLVRTSHNENEVQQFKDEWAGVADIISIQEYIPTLPDYDQNISILPSDRSPYPQKFRPSKSNKFCSSLWQRMSIRANGDMYACCHMNYELKIGNFNDMSIKQAWNSDFMNGLRLIHQSGMYESINPCNTCLHGC